MNENYSTFDPCSSFHRSDVERIMQVAHDYRKATGTEEYWMRRDILQNLIEELLDGFNHWKALAESREDTQVMQSLRQENIRLRLLNSMLESKRIPFKNNWKDLHE